MSGLASPVKKLRTPPLFLDSQDKTDEARTSFQEISECIYANKQLGHSGQNEQMTCDCHEKWDQATQRNLACGEHSECINRATSVECVNKSCGCGDDCQNQRFQKKEYANVSVIQTELKGYGLRANEEINESGFIYEYVGEVINEESFRKRMVEYDEKKFPHFYFMMLKKDSFIDATIKGSLARFCNHSCSPNAYVDKWVDSSRRRDNFRLQCRQIRRSIAALLLRRAQLYQSNGRKDANRRSFASSRWHLRSLGSYPPNGETMAQGKQACAVQATEGRLNHQRGVC